MYNTTRTIIFSVASILLFLVYPIIQDVTLLFTAFTLGRFLPDIFTLEFVSAFVFIYSFLAFAIFQALTRFVLFRRVFKSSNAVMSYPISSFYIGDRLVYYIVPFFVLLLPLFRQFHLAEIIMLRIGLFIITLLFFEGILRYSKSTTNVYFLKDGLLVKGNDLRLDFPLSGRLFNMSGFYPYDKIHHYLINESSVEFKLAAESGRIEFNFPPEDRGEIKDFIKMMGIPHSSSKN